MVFFAINRKGYESFIALNLKHVPFWISNGITSNHELVTLRAMGFAISVLNYSVDSTDKFGMEKAIDTIKQHHPDCTVWIGY